MGRIASRLDARLSSEWYQRPKGQLRYGQADFPIRWIWIPGWYYQPGAAPGDYKGHNVRAALLPSLLGIE